jgi:DNA-binding IclR family transcriptional regulator
MPSIPTSSQFLAPAEKPGATARGWPGPDGGAQAARQALAGTIPAAQAPGGTGPAAQVSGGTTPAARQASGGTTPAARQAPGGTQSTQRLLTLLDQFSTERPAHTVEGLSEAIGVPRSTVYRLVSLLKAYELLEQAGESKYQLGPKAIMMGYVARSTVDLADVWRPGLEQLAGASRETALVLRRIGDAAVCIDRVECDHPVRLSFDVGKAMPLHTGAGAKVLLSGSPAELRDRYIETAVPPEQRARLRAELESIAVRGWGESHAEVDPGIWAVAAPILADRDGRCLAISVAVPEYRLEAGRREELIGQTRDIAAALQAKLSHYV